VNAQGSEKYYIWWKGVAEIFSVLKIFRQCPLFLLVEVLFDGG
jgi:hypothetical protein